MSINSKKVYLHIILKNMILNGETLEALLNLELYKNTISCSLY